MTKKVFFRILFAVLILNSCGPSKLSPKEYASWFSGSENGMIKTQVNGEQTLTCQYLTPELISIVQYGPELLEKDSLTAQVDEIAKLEHFKLKFQRKSSNNFLRDNYTTEEEFHRKSMYLSFDIQKDLRLVAGNDTVKCALSHHERTYGNTPYETLLISFPKKEGKETSDMLVILEDRVFGFGRTKFLFEESDLRKVPDLTF